MGICRKVRERHQRRHDGRRSVGWGRALVFWSLVQLLAIGGTGKGALVYAVEATVADQLATLSETSGPYGPLRVSETGSMRKPLRGVSTSALRLAENDALSVPSPERQGDGDEETMSPYSQAMGAMVLAGIAKDSQEYEEARSHYERAVEIVEAAGIHQEAPWVVKALAQLGMLHERAGRDQAAEKAYKRSLQISEVLFGAVHPLLVAALNRLADFYAGQERLQEARHLRERVAEIKERSR